MNLAAPILQHHIPSINWSSYPAKGSLEEHAKELFKEASKMTALPGSKAKIETETGQETPFLQLANHLLQNGTLSDFCQEVSKMTDQTLMVSIIQVWSETDITQTESHEYDEAWIEIQVQHTLQKTILFLETERRNLYGKY